MGRDGEEGGMHRLLRLAVPCVLVVATACGTRVPVTERQPDLDFKLSKYAWMEEGKLVTLIVNTLATRDRGTEPYIPLEVMVSNNGVRKLTLSRESFTLVDDQGNRHPAAGPRELLERYDYLDQDRRLAELPAIVANRFATYRLYPNNFTPRPSDPRIVRDRLTLPKFGVMHDFLYFPTPEGGVMGKRLELFLTAPELEHPVFVKFEVR
jgi:hypothetical protein